MTEDTFGVKCGAVVRKARAAMQPRHDDLVLPPNDQELAQLRALRSEGVIDDYPAAVQYLDYLFARCHSATKNDP